METLEQGLQDIAREMKQIHDGPFQEEDYYQLVYSTYLSMRQQFGGAMEEMDSATITRVLRKQMGELVRLGHADKLLMKRNHVAPPIKNASFEALLMPKPDRA